MFPTMITGFSFFLFPIYLFLIIIYTFLTEHNNILYNRIIFDKHKYIYKYTKYTGKRVCNYHSSSWILSELSIVSRPEIRLQTRNSWGKDITFHLITTNIVVKEELRFIFDFTGSPIRRSLCVTFSMFSTL